MALTPMDSGEILIDGKKLTKNSYEKITFIPDAITMLTSMKIAEAFGFMKDFYKTWNEDRADEILRFFRLQKDERIGDLSKGNTAKVNLLSRLQLHVVYVLMDEPFSAIDASRRAQLPHILPSHLVPA